MIKAAVLGLVLALLASCAGNFNNIPGDTNPAHSDYCLRTNQRHRVGGALAAGFTASATALAAAAAMIAKDHPNTALDLGVAGTLSGIGAGAMQYYAQDAFNTYQEMCMPLPSPTTAAPVMKGTP